MNKMRHLATTILMIPAFILLAGCAQRYQNLDEYMGAGDFNFRYFGGSGSLITEAPLGYYFIANEFIFYADKDTMAPVVLCGRPHCLHDNEANEALKALCNAFFPSGPTSYIEYYEGNLYIFAHHLNTITLDLRTSLFRVSLDGSRRDIVFDTTTPHTPGSIAIHRGVVYYAESAYTIDGVLRYGIMAFDLNSRGASPEMIYIGEEDRGSVGGIFAYGNNLFFLETGFNRAFLSRVDIVNRTGGRPFAKPYGADWNQNLHTIHNGKILFANWQVLFTTTPGNVEQLHLYTANLDGQEPVRQMHLEMRGGYIGGGRHMSDGEHLWFSDNALGGDKPMAARGTWVVDPYTGGVIATVLRPDDMPPFEDFNSSTFLPGGERHAFFIIGGTFTGSPIEIWYADKSLMETDSMEWRLLIKK